MNVEMNFKKKHVDILRDLNLLKERNLHFMLIRILNIVQCKF